MQDALTIIYQIYTRFFQALFNKMYIEPNTPGLPGTGVVLGWVMIVIIVMNILIKNVLAIPHKGQSITRSSDSQGHKYWS